MSEASHPNIVVVGAGAAGLIAAKSAAQCGATVTLLEKKERVGLKILISGGGKCNLTHTGGIREIRAAFRPNESRFLKAAFYRYFSHDLLSILHEAGVQTYARPDGRIFPVEPASARDVVRVLERSVRDAGAAIVTRTPVTGIAVVDGHVTGIRIENTFRPADAVIVAVGGSSYPGTGTTGDGWRWAADAGHTIAPLRSALAPIYIERAEPDWSGVALRDIVLRARLSMEGKEYASWRGDLLFTHRGLSGPAALGIARDVAEKMASGLRAGGVLTVDLAPDLAFESLRTELRAELSANPRRLAGGIIDRFVPRRLAEAFASAIDIDPRTPGARMTAKALNRLVGGIKDWPLGGVKSVPLERGEVVAGGVSLDEVDPQTMQSRLVSGLYLCGEVLDIAGPVGGYNLQAAWSTGFVAGEAAAKMAQTSESRQVAG